MKALDLAAQLRGVAGCEEQWIAGERSTNIPAACHVLLARCLTAPGRRFAHHLLDVRALSLAERDWLLVQLRCRTLGPRAASEATCSACGLAATVDFNLHDLPLQPEPPAEQMEVALPSGWILLIRGLTAGDHEDCAAAAGLDRAGQIRLLVSRTLIEGVNPSCDLMSLTVDDLTAVEQALAAASPEPLVVELDCLQCGERLSAPLDLCAFVIAELREHSRTLLDDVHHLASIYHWSEAEILALPLSRRLEYLLRIEADRDASLFGPSQEFLA